MKIRCEFEEIKNLEDGSTDIYCELSNSECILPQNQSLCPSYPKQEYEKRCHKCKKEINTKSSHLYDPNTKRYTCWDCATKNTPLEKKKKKEHWKGNEF